MQDTGGLLLRTMEETVDGEYQDYKSKNGAYVRQHFFGKHPELKAMVADWSDDQIWGLLRGGHDPLKVYAAYAAAVTHKGQPTLILAKTVKGYGMGEAGEGQNITHQQKKMGENSLREFRDRFRTGDLGRSAQRGALHPLRRGQRGAEIPARASGRARRQPPVSAPEVGRPSRSRHCRPSKASSRRRTGARSRRRWRSCESSTRSCATSRSASASCRSSRTKSRTFGMEGMFRQFGIFSPGRTALPAGGRQPAHVLQGG